VQSHFFLDPQGDPYPEDGTRAASITHSFVDGNQNQKMSITFPFGFVYAWNESGSVRGELGPGGGPDSSRGRLLMEVLQNCFGLPGFNGGRVSAPEAAAFRGVRALAASPNPFNPATAISFELGARSRATVRVYNLRGQLVITLLDEVRDAGPVDLVWRGVDDDGDHVATGVFLVEAVGDGQSQVRKVALLR
jgi:hypothetical protein